MSKNKYVAAATGYGSCFGLSVFTVLAIPEYSGIALIASLLLLIMAYSTFTLMSVRSDYEKIAQELNAYPQTRGKVVALAHYARFSRAQYSLPTIEQTLALAKLIDEDVMTDAERIAYTCSTEPLPEAKEFYNSISSKLPKEILRCNQATTHSSH